MSIFEYDQEEHLRMEREESLEEGRALGHREGLAEGHSLGREEEKHATFLQMACMGMPVDVIAQVLRESADVVKLWMLQEGMEIGE